MSAPDLNLLITLHAILSEGSVTGAAKRLQLSPSAVSRGLGRLRQTTGDPLLVRAGRGLVPTPRALELRDRVGQLVNDAEAVLRPAAKPDLRLVTRTFTVRSSDGFVENFGPGLLARVAEEAPGVRLHFVQKVETSTAALRGGPVDLETGVVAQTTGPELRVRSLFRDRFVGVVRKRHPLARGQLTPARYFGADHVSVSRTRILQGPIDDAFEQVGQARHIVTVVSGFGLALSLARVTDLVATVPERHTGNLRAGMHTFDLPVSTPEIKVSMLWHPRLHSDPVHRWLRGLVLDVCEKNLGA